MAFVLFPGGFWLSGVFLWGGGGKGELECMPSGPGLGSGVGFVLGFCFGVCLRVVLLSGLPWFLFFCWSWSFLIGRAPWRE